MNSIGQRSFKELICRICSLLVCSKETKKYFFKMTIVSITVCILDLFLPKELIVLNFNGDIVDLYVTLFGFSFSAFAIFLGDIEKLSNFCITKENGNTDKSNPADEILSISIVGLIMPLLAIIPNIITIPGFHIFCFYDNYYWNVYWGCMSVLWIIYSVLHIVSLKIIQKTNN